MKRIKFLAICVLTNVGFPFNLFSNSDVKDFVTVEGFVAGTPVKTPSGYSPIEKIIPGDMIMSCDFQGNCVERQVTHIKNNKATRTMKLSIGGQEIRMGFSGKLFAKDSWVNATSTAQTPSLMNALYELIRIDGSEMVDGEVILYSLSVEEFENYYVSYADILVHNHTQAEADAAFASASKKDRAQVLIMEQFQKQKFNNAMQLSYILATAEHETMNFATMKEIGGEKKSYAPWYGRGYPQLTHKTNYEKYTKLLGRDLIANPDDMLREDVSAAVIVDGMMYGVFTGVKLSHFINDNRCDFVAARKTVNAEDCKDKIAVIARRWAQYFRERKTGQYAGLLSWLNLPANHQSCN